MKIRNTLAGITLLGHLSAEELRATERRCRWRRYNAKKQIFDRESDGRDIYFIVDGAVQIVNYSAAGREIAFAQFDNGNYFGELSALDGKSRSASAVAAEECLLAIMSAAAFKEMLLQHPDMAIEVLLRLTHIVRDADSRIMDLSTLSAINRVHGEILRMADSIRADDNRAVIKRLPTHSDIASRASTTRETVSRVLSNLNRVQLVRRAGNGIEILDVDRRRDMVEQING